MARRKGHQGSGGLLGFLRKGRQFIMGGVVDTALLTIRPDVEQTGRRFVQLTRAVHQPETEKLLVTGLVLGQRVG